MQKRTLAIIAGWSYVVIFFAAIFANFFILDSLKSDPVRTVQDSQFLIRLGIMAFILTVVFDVVVAWALQLLEPKHPLTILSTLFRMMHAGIMAVGVSALVEVLSLNDSPAILNLVERFNNIWLIGLLFFGVHLILLARIMKIPKWMAIAITLAGVMYIIDTSAHFMLPNYKQYADIFLTLVAVPSILGEMAFTVWLLIKGGKK